MSTDDVSAALIIHKDEQAERKSRKPPRKTKKIKKWIQNVNYVHIRKNDNSNREGRRKGGGSLVREGRGLQAGVGEGEGFTGWGGGGVHRLGWEEGRGSQVGLGGREGFTCWVGGLQARVE